MIVKYFSYWDYKTIPKANWKESGFDYHKDEDFMEYHKSNPEWFSNILETPNITNSNFSNKTQRVETVKKSFLHLHTEQDIDFLDEELGSILPESVKELFHLYGLAIYRNMEGPNSGLQSIAIKDKWTKSCSNPDILSILSHMKGTQLCLDKKIELYEDNQRYSFLGLYPFFIWDEDDSEYFLISNKIKRGLYYFFNFFSSQPLEYLGSMSDYIQKNAQPEEYYGDRFRGIRECIDREILYTSQKIKASSNAIANLLKESEAYKNLRIEFSSLGLLIKSDENLKTIFILIAHDNMYEYMQNNIPATDYLFTYYYKQVINETELVIQDVFANLEMLGFGERLNKN